MSSLSTPRCAALIVGLLTPVVASADWPSWTRVAGGPSGIPVGVALRTWAPTDDVYVFFEERDQLADEGSARLHRYRCSDRDGCATASIVSLTHVGAPVFHTNLLHPTMAVRRPAGAPVELLLGMRQKLEPDCNGDGLTAEEGDVADQDALDLYTVVWDAVNGLGEGLAVEVNTPLDPECLDHGITGARFVGATGWMCTTQVVGTGQSGNRMVCDNAAGATSQWVNEVQLNSGSADTFEDHGAFDHYGANQDLVVAAHLGGNGDDEPDQIRVHFPDAAAPPDEPMVTFDATGNDFANHPSLVVGDGKIHLVWDDHAKEDAQIRYTSCDFAPGIDCTDPAQWNLPTPVADPSTGFNRDARYPQIQVDGEKQFVLFQYDTVAGENVKMRVVVAERCGTGPWTHEVVRTPDRASWDQSVEVGRPGIVLDRVEKIVHVAFVELDDFGGNADFASPTDGDLYWYRKEYESCP